MNIRFQLDFDDLIAFQQDVIQFSYTHHIKRNYFKWISSIILLAVLLYLLPLTIIGIAVSVAASLIYFSISVRLYSSMQLTKLKKKMQQNDYTHVLGNCSMTLSETGIDRTINDEKKHFPWNEFEQVREDAGHFFLYVNDLQGLIVSKDPEGLTLEENANFHQLMKQYTDDVPRTN